MQISSQQIKQVLTLILLWTVAYLVFGTRLGIALAQEVWKRYHQPILGSLVVNIARSIFLVRLSIALAFECWQRYNHLFAATANTLVIILADAFPPFELLQLRWWPSTKLGINSIQATTVPAIDVYPSRVQEAQLPIPNPWEEPLPEQPKPNSYLALKAPVSAVIALLPVAAKAPIVNQSPTSTQTSLMELTVRELRKLARNRKVSRYGSLTKNALIAALST
jgi:hypothetical protein